MVVELPLCADLTLATCGDRSAWFRCLLSSLLLLHNSMGGVPLGGTKVDRDGRGEIMKVVSDDKSRAAHATAMCLILFGRGAKRLKGHCYRTIKAKRSRRCLLLLI